MDLSLQHRRIAEDVEVVLRDVMANAEFVLGSRVERFEREFATYCGARHAVGVGNGTDAVEIALRSVGVGRGDEVILPANTFVATAEAVVRCGATPVLVDCDEDFLIDPALVGERLTSRTRAVIPVHLYGQMARVEAVREAVGAEVAIVEDAAQAQGAERFGRRAGSLGDVAATSFYPGKNLGAYGDAGAVLTDSDAAAESIRAFRNHGGVRKHEHVQIGVNSRLDGIQAAVLSIKLSLLDAWNKERQSAAVRYQELLAENEQIALPAVTEGNEHVWHLYVVRVPNRDRAVSDLNTHGIGAGIHYPTPVHLLPAFSVLGCREGDFPVAERLSKEILSLPIFPGITEEQQDAVAAALRLELSGQ
ncbi:DegT/DnrJ/EryC1/StrS family aminotransferase [Rhodococcus sp. NPDC127527]|uniref:DegT/DnrJ/EryC1/StrS family aminotransferase n=1 Tax=Rhodococcus sp. NPDC127527 TaxID=3345394 RepID=UPI003642301F